MPTCRRRKKKIRPARQSQDNASRGQWSPIVGGHSQQAAGSEHCSDHDAGILPLACAALCVLQEHEIFARTIRWRRAGWCVAHDKRALILGSWRGRECRRKPKNLPLSSKMFLQCVWPYPRFHYLLQPRLIATYSLFRVMRSNQKTMHALGICLLAPLRMITKSWLRNLDLRKCKATGNHFAINLQKKHDAIRLRQVEHVLSESFNRPSLL